VVKHRYNLQALCTRVKSVDNNRLHVITTNVKHNLKALIEAKPPPKKLTKLNKVKSLESEIHQRWERQHACVFLAPRESHVFT